MSEASSVSGGHPEGRNAGKELAPGNHPREDSDPRVARYPAVDDYWKERGRPPLSRARRAEIEEENCQMLKASIEKLKVWDDKILQMEYVRDVIQDQIDTLERVTNRPRREDYIIAFVKEMVRENEFIKFQSYLKQRDDIIQDKSDRRHIFKILVQKERIHEGYDELTFQDIVNAINGRIVDLKIEQHLKDRERQAANKDTSTFPEEDNTWFSMCSALFKDEHKLVSNPIEALVKAIRQEGYVMDMDPEKELDKIMAADRVFYFNHFRRKVTVKYSENVVQVRGVPLNYDEEQVRVAFSACGEIEDVKLQRGGPWAKIAFLTFKESEGAKIAPFLMDRAAFRISPVQEPRKYTTNRRSRHEHKKALRRYNEFRCGIV